MSSSSKIIGELAPWAILGVGVLLIAKNPQLIADAVNWLYNAIPSKKQQQQMSTGQTPAPGNNVTILPGNLFGGALGPEYTQPNGDWWWKAAIPPLYFWDVLTGLMNGGNGNQSPAPTSPTPTPQPVAVKQPNGQIKVVNSMFQAQTSQASIWNAATFPQQLKAGAVIAPPAGSKVFSTAKPLSPGWFPTYTQSAPKVQTSSVPLSVNGGNGSKGYTMYSDWLDQKYKAGEVFFNGSNVRGTGKDYKIFLA